MAGERPRVVIIGGGFAGLAAARSLGRAPVDVTLIDRRNHHLFLPLLYQVATAGLNPSDIAAPIRGILRRHRNITVLMADAESVDSERRCVSIVGAVPVPFDYLIVAAGSVAAWFGQEEWTAHAPALLSLEEALEIRKRLLLAFEIAEREEDAVARVAWLTFVIIGGGPTGVELAGAIAEMARHTLARDFRRIDPRSARVILLESADRLLRAMPADLSARAARSLARLGVTVRLGLRVERVDAAGVTVAGDRIEARTVLWAAGVAASPLGATLMAPRDAVGRVAVLADLSVPGRPEIFVAGDMAAVAHGAGLVPGLAPAAMQAGRHAALNIQRRIAGLPTVPFRYADRGALATIGRASAVAVFGRMRLSGYPAWLAWLAIHIWFLIGFRNRVLVMIQWAWAYWTRQRGARLVTHPGVGAAKG